MTESTLREALAELIRLGGHFYAMVEGESPSLLENDHNATAFMEALQDARAMTEETKPTKEAGEIAEMVYDLQWQARYTCGPIPSTMSKAASLLTRLQRKKEELAKTFSMQQVAISIATFSNVPSDRADRLLPGHPYNTLALQDVYMCIDREIAAREAKEAAERELVAVQKNANIIYAQCIPHQGEPWPPMEASYSAHLAKVRRCPNCEALQQDTKEKK